MHSDVSTHDVRRVWWTLRHYRRHFHLSGLQREEADGKDFFINIILLPSPVRDAAHLLPQFAGAGNFHALLSSGNEA